MFAFFQRWTRGKKIAQSFLFTAKIITKYIPFYRKLTLHEIKVLEINANLKENDFRMKKINAQEEVEFHNKGN